MQMTARDGLASWLAVRRVPIASAVAAAVLAVRGWRARELTVRRGRENGDRSEVVARLRVLLERDA